MVASLQRLVTPAPAAAPEPRFCLAELAGRAVEIGTAGASAPLSQALGLVLEAQQADEPAAWVACRRHPFYPPDAAASGIDLAALAVIRAPDPAAAGRAADKLLRSGAFGLVVVELEGAALPTPLLARLAGLARSHHSALVFLTTLQSQGSALGSLISLRARSLRWREAGGFAAGLEVSKDRRCGPGWRHQEHLLPPPGLR